MGEAIHNIFVTNDPLVRTEAEQRTLELETLRLLAGAIARSLEPKEVLKKALSTLVETGGLVSLRRGLSCH